MLHALLILWLQSREYAAKHLFVFIAKVGLTEVPSIRDTDATAVACYCVDRCRR